MYQIAFWTQEKSEEMKIIITFLFSLGQGESKSGLKDKRSNYSCDAGKVKIVLGIEQNTSAIKERVIDITT